MAKTSEPQKWQLQENKERFYLNRRNWIRNNPEKIKEIQNKANYKYRKNHPDCYKRQTKIKRKKDKEWNRNHREYRNYMDMLRWMRLRSILGNFTLEEWKELKKKYNYTCLMCGKKEPEIKLSIDHIIPVSEGGTNWIENIQPLCRSCNSKKGKTVGTLAK